MRVSVGIEERALLLRGYEGSGQGCGKPLDSNIVAGQTVGIDGGDRRRVVIAGRIARSVGDLWLIGQ
jgi:hypothetical protein